MKVYTIYYEVQQRGSLYEWLCDYPYYYDKFKNKKKATKEAEKLFKKNYIKSVCVFYEDTRTTYREAHFRKDKQQQAAVA